MGVAADEGFLRSVRQLHHLYLLLCLALKLSSFLGSTLLTVLRLCLICILKMFSAPMRGTGALLLEIRCFSQLEMPHFLVLEVF